jgi:hypothetical protein
MLAQKLDQRRMKFVLAGPVGFDVVIVVGSLPRALSFLVTL